MDAYGAYYQGRLSSGVVAMAKKYATQYWAVWGVNQICTRHRSFAAAERAARKCEDDGGAPHDIYAVSQCARPERRKKELS